MRTSQKLATNPIPPWNESIHEVECADGYLLHYRVWMPQGSAKATLLLLNGIMSHSGWFRELATFLAMQHIYVVGADRRGSGLNHQERGDLPSQQVLLSDLRRIMDQEKIAAPLFLAGWCWGAVVAVNAALEFGNTVQGLVLLAPGLIVSAEIKEAMKLAMEDHDVQSGLLKNPLREEMFTDRTEIRERIRNDQLALRAFTHRLVSVSQRMLFAANVGISKVKQPILLLLAAHDQTVDNESTLQIFHNRAISDVTWTTLPYNHGMQLEAPEEVARNIIGWLTQQQILLPLSCDQS